MTTQTDDTLVEQALNDLRDQACGIHLHSTDAAEKACAKGVRAIEKQAARIRSLEQEVAEGKKTELEQRHRAQDEESRAMFAESQLSEARELLGPFARYADQQHRVPADMPITHGSPMAKRQLRMGDCYDAANFLSRTKQPVQEKVDG